MSLRGTWFLRLLTVRITGQIGDGIFQAALAAYALFGDDVAGAADLAAAAAVVLLPWSLLGPVAGVALDRWSRRQVLLVGNLVRAAVLVLLAVVVAADAPDPAVYGVALAALGVNRFLLAGLSAALPHTVAADVLTEANAIAPTLGTTAFVTGLGVAGMLRSGVAQLSMDDSGLLVLAAAIYAGAGASALLFPKAKLGPDREPSSSVPGIWAEIRAALSHLRRRRAPAAALGSLAAMRLWFGLITVSAVLSLRNATTDEAAALADLAVLTLATGAGFLGAAVLAPVLARPLGRGPALRVGLLIMALSPVPALLGAPDSETLGWWVTGGLLGLGAQTTKICVDAIVQAGVDDEARGRVFSLYDMAFNVSFVVAAGIAAAVLPTSGRSPAVLLACCVGLLATALGHRAATGPATRTRSGPSAEKSSAP